jgi:hypothetical protein
VLHAEFEKRGLGLAVVLGAVHGEVRVLTQRLVALAMVRIEADPDRGGGEDFRTVDEERRAQPLQGRLEELRHLGHALDRRQQQQEFVPGNA